MRTLTPKADLPFGALATLMKDNLYAVGGGGLIFTSPWIVSEPAERYYATIFLTSAHAPFGLTLDQTSQNYKAIALRQMTRRAVEARNVRLLSFQLDPSHRHFARFRAIPSTGLVIDRERFAAFDAELERAYRGELNIKDAARLHSNIVDTVLPLLPEAKAPDPRVLSAIALLWENHNYPLDKLSAHVGLSYDRLSHLFVESMGLTLRTYHLWRKVHKAMYEMSPDTNLRLTDIALASGFTDSSHMCKSFYYSHGAPPSYFLNPDYVKIMSAGRGDREIKSFDPPIKKSGAK